MRHCSSLSNDPECLRGLHGLCRERLKDLGVGASKSQKVKARHFPVTPGKKAFATPSSSSSTKQNVFGLALRDLAPTSVLLGQENNLELHVPHFLVAILAYLRNHLETDGLFRKAGSAGRQRQLRVEIEEAETFFVDTSKDETLSPLDVASLLKQWLRELPEPLIPFRFHDTFLKCCKLSGESKIEATLTACLLLPPLHAASLTCLMRFLSEVAEASAANKMDARSLAIVFTPSLFPVTEDATNIKKVDSTNADLANKLDIVETLIRNSSSVCMIDQKIDEALNIPTLMMTSEDNLSDDEDYESYAGGPSARRMKSQKKKRRSGSLSRVFTATMKGLHKAIRSTTPAGMRSHPVDMASTAQTPIFQSPRLPVKRKVSVDEPDCSPNSKHRKAAMESAFTPKVMRARSVSIKNRFKRKKSLTDGAKFKEPSLIIHQPFDGNSQGSKTPSLPSKPRLSSITNTPGTPGAMPTANQDLSTEAGDDNEDKAFSPNVATQSISTTSSKSSLASMDSTTSSKSYPGRVVKRKNSDRRYIGKPRSPSERKIGLVRRRSQEMAHKKALLRDDKNKLSNLPMLDESYLRSQLRRGRPNTFRIKPSPLKVEKATPDGRKTTRIKISFREGQLQSPKVDIRNPEDTSRGEASAANTSSQKNGSLRVNESLSNLRQDISSMIEKSFGPFQDPEDHEVTFGNNINDELDKFTLEELTLPRFPDRTRSMRRQSSAFEMKSKLPTSASSNVRRQSSAFELAALTKKANNFSRGVETRASLKQRNSSVKDLVKKLEVAKPSSSSTVEQQQQQPSYKRMSISTSALPNFAAAASSSSSGSVNQPEFKLPSPPMETPAKPAERGRRRSRIPVFKSPPAIDLEVEEAKDEFPANENEWMDANDFFNSNVNPHVKSRAAHLAFEETSGCKRSSIIRIRTEKKGLVSRSVDTFSKPALPPPMITPRRAPRPPARTPASAAPTTASSGRRNSARMGVAGKTPSLSGPTGIVTRRQTLTGIKTCAASSTTTTENKRASSVSNRTSGMPAPPTPSSSAAQVDEPIYGNIEPVAVRKKAQAHRSESVRNETPRRASKGVNNQHHQRRSKRLEGRRFLTIGYDGEVGRSPLRDTKNTPTVATVQRSKSAQTPSNKTKVVKRKATKCNEGKENQDDLFCQNVQRSLSLRSPRPPIVVPASLKETIYDVTTPKSEKVKRHLSDRVMTPRGGRQDAVPFIKDVLTKSRATTPAKFTGHRHPLTTARNSPRMLHRQ